MNLKPYPEYKDSGVAWLGKVPKHWEVHPLKRYAKNIINNVLSKNSDELYIALEHIEGWTGRFKKNRYAKFTGQVKKFSETDVLFGKLRPYLAKVAFPKEQGVCVGEILSIRPNGKYLLGSFVEKSLLSFHFIGIVNGATYGSKMPRAEWDFIGNLGFPILPLPEQTQIARFLDYKTAQIARFIKAKKRMIELLKEQKQIIINDAVTGKIVIKDEGGRLKAEKRPDSSFIPHPSSFLQTVPEGWEVRRLRTIATVKPSGVDKKSHEGELPVQLCNYVDVYKNQEINSSLNFMKATATPEEIKNFTLIHGDIIITKDSETWDDIAVPAIVTENMDVVCAYHLALIRTTTQEITNKYLYRAISADPIADHFRVSANGVTRFGLSQGAIKDAPIPIPSIQEQAQIVSYIETKTAALDQAISRTEREIALMQEYRTRLISDVVTGKIDVRDIEIPDIADIDDTLDESIDEPEGEEVLETEEAEE